MPELQFQIEGAEAAAYSAVPLLVLKLRVSSVWRCMSATACACGRRRPRTLWTWRCGGR
jgi:hypothetical protein